jgi:hypothetical protein
MTRTRSNRAGDWRRVCDARSLLSCTVASLIAIGVTGAVGTPAALAESCPNADLRSELGMEALPDCRADEMVTPPFKEGNTIVIAAKTPSGRRLVIQTTGAFAGTENDRTGFGGQVGALYAIERGSDEWNVQPLVPSAEEFPEYQLLDFDTSLTRTLWRLRAPTGLRSEGAGDLYLREGDGRLVHLGPMVPTLPDHGEDLYLGAASDLSRSFFRESPGQDALWPGDGTLEGHSLYEMTPTGGEPKLVGVNNAGILLSNQEAQLISQCGTDLGAPGSFELYNAISSSGATVYFSALAGPQCATPSVNELYARRNGKETVAISEPTTADCAACETSPSARLPATFWGASRDGSKVYFTTEQALLPGAGGASLYEYDFDGAPGQKVTLISRTAGGASAGVEGVGRTSEDGSHAYFVATGVLLGEANAEGRSPQEGAPNLYVFEQDARYPLGHVAFIATLSGEDSALWSFFDFERPIDTTPNGRFLLFRSSAPLTADDRSTVGQIFEYDSETGGLVRVSVGQKTGRAFLCGASERYEAGFNCDGNTTDGLLEPQIGSGDYVGGSNRNDNAIQSVSANGAYAFFTSADALTPEATQGATNVYEYHTGNVFLVSDGHDGSRIEGRPSVKFVGTDEGGVDAFFTTADALVPRDGDTQVDLYDARIGGGFAEPIAGVSCLAACQSEGTPPPSLLQATSATIAGESQAPQLLNKPVTKGKHHARKRKIHRKKRNRHAKRRRAARRSVRTP